MKPPVTFKAKNSNSQGLADKLNDLSGRVEANKPAVAGHVGVLIRPTPNGWTASVKQGAGGSGGATLPFTIERRTQGTPSEPIYEARPLPGKGRRNLGYDEADELEIEDFSDWLPVIIGDFLWLEFAIDYDDGNFAIDSVTIKAGEVGDSEWPEFPDPVAFSEEEGEENQQTRYYLALAKFIQNPSNSEDLVPFLVQLWTGDFIMKNACYDGKPIIRPENQGG
jgi:hypothetical protein